MLEKEHQNHPQQHKHNESTLLREKRIADKHAVSLQSRLDVINVSVDLIRTEHSYDIASAVKEVKRDERSHYSGLLQSHNESTKEAMQSHKHALQEAMQSHKDDLKSHEAVLNSNKEVEEKKRYEVKQKHVQSTVVSTFNKHSFLPCLFKLHCVSHVTYSFVLQLQIDRAIVAEREVERLRVKLMVADNLNDSLKSTIVSVQETADNYKRLFLSASNDISSLRTDKSAAINLLS